jgi:hypothetical protein
MTHRATSYAAVKTTLPTGDYTTTSSKLTESASRAEKVRLKTQSGSRSSWRALMQFTAKKMGVY